jgi:SAM-dependent methyltransferase
MQKRHSDRKMYFEEQVYTTSKYVIPFIEESFPVNGELKVLEVGCGEGGNLVPFLEKGCQVTGVDIAAGKIEAARVFFADHPGNNHLRLLAMDIYDAGDKLEGPFDLIFMRDVIEHIHDQDRFMGYIKRFLEPGGVFFLAFPPWYNPFGGHQQICENRLLSKLPYFHLLPVFLYKSVLKVGGESEKKIESLLEIKETGISIERFLRIAKKHGYRVEKNTHFFINPNYEVKFGMRPRKQLNLINQIAFFRNVFTTSVYFLINLKEMSK